MILIDSNEQSTNPVLVDKLKNYFTGQCVITHLSAGDIHVPLSTGLLIIERKAISDLLASIADSRLFSQVENIVNLAQFAVIIAHGSLMYGVDDEAVVDGKSTNWRGVSVRAALLAVQWAGCAVAHCSNAALPETVREVISLASKPEHAQKSSKHRSITFPPIDQRADILAQFPGVGHKRAEAVLRFVARLQNPESNELGRLCDAIDWATLFPFIAEDSRPPDWGEKMLLNFRLSLGLEPNEVLTVQKITGESNYG